MLELRGVSRAYGQGTRTVKAVDDVSLRIAEGDFMVLVGPSGSGKSTLLQLIGGMDRPSGGVVSLEGRNLAEMRDRELADVRLRTFGFVFQQFNLIPTLSAEQNIQAALAPAGVRTHERHERAKALLGEVGLADRGDHLPGELSGGEQQRVAIARALANEPRVVLADEPTGNLDTETGRGVIALLEQLCRTGGRTLVIATHDRAVARASSRVVYLRDGAVERTTRVRRAEEDTAEKRRPRAPR